MSKISVITPIYRTEKYLDKCLQSLVCQTLQDIEFIWIDNQANDICKKIIAKYENYRPNIQVIHLDKNVGYNGAMRLGLERATGDFVGFCDSDGWLDFDYYETLYSKVSTNTDVVYCEYVMEYPNGNQTFAKFRKNYIEKARGGLLDVIPTGSVWNAIFKKDFLLQNNINFSTSKNSIYKDNYFAIQAAWFAQYPEIVDGLYYHYVQRHNSTINDISLSKQQSSTYELLEEIFSTLPFENVSEEQEKIVVDYLLRSLSVFSLKKLPSNTKWLSNSKYYQEQYKKCKAFSYPSFGQRIFSISEHYSKPYKKIRLLGFSFKLKQKKGTL